MEQTVSISDSTIAYNTAGIYGGGIYSDPSYILNNSIVVGNTGRNGPDDIYVNQAAFPPNVKYSLIGVANSNARLVNGVNGNQIGVSNPEIGTTLANNGGPTQTIALLPGSPAIDAGNNALAVDANGNPLFTDQVGNARISNGTVDIGAFEFHSAPPQPVNQTIIFGRPTNTTYGAADFTVNASASSGLPVKFTATGNCTVTQTGTVWDVHITGWLAPVLLPHTSPAMPPIMLPQMWHKRSILPGLR